MNMEIGRDLPSDRTSIINDLRLPRCTPRESRLVVETAPIGLDLQQHDCFIGMGVASFGRPIDVVALLLGAAEMRSLTVVLVDEFAKMNGIDHRLVEANVEAQQRLIRGVNECYHLDVMVLRAGPIMATQRYAKEVALVQHDCLKQEYQELLAQTVPQSRRNQDLDYTYSVNEIALTRIMAEGLGYSIKFGPSREKSYDNLMQAMRVPISFCYALDALPVGVSNPKPVVHYVSSNVGSFGAERILLESDNETISNQLLKASPQSAIYLLRLAKRAAELRGIELSDSVCDEHELIQVMRAAVFEHVVNPLRSAV